MIKSASTEEEMTPEALCTAYRAQLARNYGQGVARASLVGFNPETGKFAILIVNPEDLPNWEPEEHGEEEIKRGIEILSKRKPQPL